MTREETVQLFQVAMGQSTGVGITSRTKKESLELLRFHGALVMEEFDEWVAEAAVLLVHLDQQHASSAWNLEAFTKELADLQYTISGLAAAFNIPLHQVFHRVHQSNMSKLDDDGKPVKALGGKVIKGNNYKPPYLGDLV